MFSGEEEMKSVEGSSKQAKDHIGQAIKNQGTWSVVRDTQEFVGRIETIVLSVVKLDITKTNHCFKVVEEPT